MVILLMGVSGVGKTEVGRRLARQLGWAFWDADDLHPPANVAKMRAGVALDDDDRAPWLRAVRGVIEDAGRRGEDGIVACSALKTRYREALMADAPHVRVVHLTAPPDVIRVRLEGRRGHFMSAALLDSQLRALEPPADALVVDTEADPDMVAARIRAGLGLTGA